jgi:hypothetical protein
MEGTVNEIQKAIDGWVGSDPDNVGRILDFLADACYATASHVAENWQDKKSAKAWERIAADVQDAQRSFIERKPY